MDFFFFFLGGGFFETFLEGSVYHIIYRDYIANRRSVIYCSLASLTFTKGIYLENVIQRMGFIIIHPERAAKNDIQIMASTDYARPTEGSKERL